MLLYLRRRWSQFARLWRSQSAPVLPYFIVRGMVEAEFERRTLIIDTFVDIAVLMLIGLVLDSTTQQHPWWIILGASAVAYVIVVVIALALNLTGNTLAFADEEQRIIRCMEFIRKQQFSPSVLEDIALMAGEGHLAAQTRIPLPTLMLTAIATVVVIGNLPFAIAFTLSMMALLSLLSFATTVDEANANLIVQKTLVLFRREREREQQKQAQAAFLLGLLSISTDSTNKRIA